MRIQLLSDVHVEFDDDEGVTFIESLDPTDVDVLVIAGDLASFPFLENALFFLCHRYEKTQVVYVPGNHEYYAGSVAEVELACARAKNALPNLHVLNRSFVTIHDVHFVGATLWYQPLWFNWNDFRHISDNPRTWIPQRGCEDREWFARNLIEGCVAVSHMLPSRHCIAPRWVGSPSNNFFVNDLTPLIERVKPKLWLFGHTHDRVDVTVGETRLVCNPRAYPHEKATVMFDPKLVLEV